MLWEKGGAGRRRKGRSGWLWVGTRSAVVERKVEREVVRGRASSRLGVDEGNDWEVWRIERVDTERVSE